MASILYPEVGARGAAHVDLDTRKAALKAQLGQALTPYEINRLAGRQAIDEESARVQAQSPIYGDRPSGIDVNSYSGSMWNGTATPIAGYQPRRSMEPTADAILRGRFGAPPNERGVIDIAGSAGPTEAPAPFTVNDSVARRASPMVPPENFARNVPRVDGDPTALQTLLRGSNLDPMVRSNRLEYERTRNALAMHELATAPKKDAASLANTRARTAREQYELATGPEKDAASLDHTRAATDELRAKPGVREAAAIERARLAEEKANRGGFASADEARKSIPEGSKGQVQQAANGRWVVQYSVNDDPREGPSSPLDKLVRERDAWKAKGRADVVAEYDRAIQNYTTKFDAFGNPVGAGGAKSAAAPAAAGETELPTLTPEQANKLPKGTKFKTTDGRTLTKQ